MLDTTSKPEPSEPLKASPYLMRCFELGLPIDVCEKHARDAVQLEELYSSIPFYRQRAERDPDYWNKFSSSRPNW